MNRVRFLHLSTTARRNSPYSNPFSQAKAKTVTGREEWRGVRDGDAHEKQISPRSRPERAVKILPHFSPFGSQSNAHRRRENCSRTDLDRFPVETAASISARDVLRLTTRIDHSCAQPSARRAVSEYSQWLCCSPFGSTARNLGQNLLTWFGRSFTK
jgi:hypothetical protein